jgi:transcriptional pleiotropic regulator of transition state genes
MGIKGETNMKSTGMVRKVDELGRIVLPAEIRQNLDIQVKDAIEIFTEGERIILQKYQPSCIFCNNVDNVVYFQDKRVCNECIAKLKNQF